MKPSFCAECTRPHADLVLRGMHWLCPSCDPESDAPRRPLRVGPERGYDVPEVHEPIGPTGRAFARAANRVTGPSRFTKMHAGSTASSSRPGFITVRVPMIRDDGTAMDATEARETLRGEPWFAEVQHRGSTLRYHLFDRPDVALAREIRSKPTVDVMAQLRAAAAGGGRKR